MIVTDDDLKKRAEALGISLTFIRDDKTESNPAAAFWWGEVSETEGGILKKKETTMQLPANLPWQK